MKHSLLFLFILTLCGVRAFAGEYEYGLKITTFPSPYDRFTSLSLDEGKLIPSKRQPLTMSFEIMNRRENAFGSIFRIISDKGYNVDLIYTYDLEGRRYPILVCGSDVKDVPSEISFDDWIPVSIAVNPMSGSISLNYDGICVEVNDDNIKGASGFRIAFGLCRFSGYSLDDVASVNLRNVAIRRGNRLIRHWPLSCHDGDYCTDDVDSSPAIAVNPVWILDQYITWDSVMTLEYDDEPSVAYGKDGVIYIITDGKRMEKVNTEDNSSTVIEDIGGTAPINAPEQLLFTGRDIFAYNVDDGLYARYNGAGKRWEGVGDFTPESHYWNKTSIWWEKENALVSFGGYGFYHYNNELMVQYPYCDKENVRVKLDGINPRYSAASAIIGDTLYIFGGRGNPSGKQELSPIKYYDLYAVNLKTFDVRKLWEFDEDPEFEFVPSGNMIYDGDRDCFYVFTDQGGGTLISISPHNQGYELMSLPITCSSNAQYHFFNLWMDRDGDKLYGMVEQSQVDGRSTVDILKINYPPIKVDSLRQNMVILTPADEPTRRTIYVWPVAAGILIAGAFIYLRGRRRWKEADVAVYLQAEGEEPASEEKFYNFDRSGIRFFGGFCVTDKDGNNITSQFTPTLKSLFVLLILNSCGDSAGIISNKLNRILWPYKPEDTANNNRNVYISKLRPILEQIGNISVINQNRFWSIQLGEGVTCDYMEARHLLESSQDETGIARLLELLLSGVMLPNIEQDWVNEFKGEFSCLTIDFLTRQLGRKDLSPGTILKICDTVFQHDSMNEEALKNKCRILYSQGRVGLAKSAYDSFCKEYSASLGMNYPVSLKSLVS